MKNCCLTCKSVTPNSRSYLKMESGRYVIDYKENFKGLTKGFPTAFSLLSLPFNKITLLCSTSSPRVDSCYDKNPKAVFADFKPPCAQSTFGRFDVVKLQSLPDFMLIYCRFDVKQRCLSRWLDFSIQSSGFAVKDLTRLGYDRIDLSLIRAIKALIQTSY